MVKTRPHLIRPEETESVKAALARHPKARNYRMAVKDKMIVIYESMGLDMDKMMELFEGFPVLPNARERLEEEKERHDQFAPVMRFILDDQERREYHAERWCYSGSIDDWIYASHSGRIDNLAKKLIPTLGTEEFFELY